MGLIFRLKFLAGPHIMQSPVLGRFKFGQCKGRPYREERDSRRRSCGVGHDNGRIKGAISVMADRWISLNIEFDVQQ